jgi:uncharacterized protein
MTSSPIKQRVESAVKDAMRARDKQRLGALRLMSSELKRVEVDERIELDDARILQIFDKMAKQRKDSLAQYQSAGREFMPELLDEAAIATLVANAIRAVGATSMKAMGQVMAELRPQVQGRADMGVVSDLVKRQLSG